MLPMKALPVTVPGVDLALFRTITTPETVNEVDRKREQPVSKFAELAVDALYKGGSWPFKHLTLTFYFELPLHTFSDLTSFGELSITSVPEGLQAKGLATGSFIQWRDFLVWATTEDQTPLLRMFAAMIHNHVAKMPPFNTLQISPFRDSTYALVKT